MTTDMASYTEADREQIAEAAQDSDASSESDSGDEQVNSDSVEWLATGRAKRSTAGNRMKSMLAAEEPDDDLELLFAEDGDDAGFTDVDGDGSDVQMDSSSDDEDAQENADDMEGERELEKQARENRQASRKRKAQEAIPLKFRKKVKIAASTSGPAPPQNPKPRPKKKSERLSWLPTAADMPTRASQRQTTMLGKEALHQQMQEREAKRLQQVEAMERKAKKMEALKKPPMTQAERLAEAAIVEKRNAKSLNRWEEAEKLREEERKAKLAALNNRTLDGPVMTFWSGMGEWVDGKLKHIGKIVTVEDKPVKKKRSSTAVVDGTGEATEAEMKAEGTEAHETAQRKDQTTEPTTGDVDSPNDQLKPAESQNSNLHNDTTSKTLITAPTGPGAPADTEISTNGHQEAPTIETVASPTRDIKEPAAGNSVAENHTQQIPGPPTPDLKEPPQAPLASGLQKCASPDSSQSKISSPTPAQQIPFAPKGNASQEKSTNAPPTGPSPTPGTLEPNKPTAQPSPVENPAIQGSEDAQSSAAKLPGVEQVAGEPEADQATRIETPDSTSLDMKSPSLGPPETPQPPVNNTYTTSMFAPPASTGFMKAPEVQPSSNRFLAPPAGVSQGGLSMPVLGYQSAPVQSTSGVLAPPDTTQGQSPLSMHPAPSQSTKTANPDPKAEQNPPHPVQSTAAAGQIPPAPNRRGPKPNAPSRAKPTKASSHRKQQQQQQQDMAVPSPPPTPPPNGKATRNCIVLQNFNENAIKEKTVQNRILFGKDMNKLAKPIPAPKCVITNQPARYKDPQTGLPYYNCEAFKKIRELERGDYKWSRLVGAWLGNGSTAAQGVPARFLDPSAPAPPKPAPPTAQPVENNREAQDEASKTEVKQSIDPSDKAIPAEKQTPSQDTHSTKSDPPDAAPPSQAALEVKSSMTTPVQIPEKTVATPTQEPPADGIASKSVGPDADSAHQPSPAAITPTNSTQEPPTRTIEDTKP